MTELNLIEVRLIGITPARPCPPKAAADQAGDPSRKDHPRQFAFDKAAYRDRNKVERLIGRLEQYRRIATCYEKRAANYLAMVTLGMIMLCLT